jgi:hypothetical protein
VAAALSIRTESLPSAGGGGDACKGGPVRWGALASLWKKELHRLTKTSRCHARGKVGGGQARQAVRCRGDILLGRGLLSLRLRSAPVRAPG